eukprot:CAMPEP_0206261706 /NCGR_PEP_ID=MMETSP0047_2-20121206/27808_1 /ASSEMBLY_ACC=CAM_ASM_000192 /TAXON_ID=195065 /ORGANISM="Chroomonas mesostigmatica_cf, Strain CCMP1168" /LENGTH=147 /DNA_ID=CAMNT_0053688959 /DNA_START=70 /DNA_END=512 /DNA_ORIENTATION=-
MEAAVLDVELIVQRILRALVHDQTAQSFLASMREEQRQHVDTYKDLDDDSRTGGGGEPGLRPPLAALDTKPPRQALATEFRRRCEACCLGEGVFGAGAEGRVEGNQPTDQVGSLRKVAHFLRQCHILSSTHRAHALKERDGIQTLNT